MLGLAGGGSPCYAVEMPSINVEVNEVSSERSLSSMIEFADILLRVTKYGDRWTASQLTELLTTIPFNLNLLRRNIKSVLDCKDVTIRNTREFLKDRRICGVSMRGGIGEKDSVDKLYLKDVTEALRQQREFCGKDELTIRSGYGNDFLRAAFQTMITD